MRTTNGLNVPEGWGGSGRPSSAPPRRSAPTGGRAIGTRRCPTCGTELVTNRDKSLPFHIFRVGKAWEGCTTTTTEEIT